MMLKSDLHIHTKEDAKDIHITYSARELIDKASEMGYDVISITHHDFVFYDESLRKYAADKGIILIPGIEKTINRKHVLIYNISQKEADKINRLSDLKLIRRKGTLVVAAHPFFPLMGVGRKLIRFIDLFDGIEFSYLHNKFVNFNKRAISTAKKYGKPIVANSDLHDIDYLGSAYSMIDSKKDVVSIIESVKNNQIKIFSKPVNFVHVFNKAFSLVYVKFKRFKRVIKQKIKRKKKQN